MLAARERDYIIGLPSCPRCGGQVLRRQGGSRECLQCGHDPDQKPRLVLLEDTSEPTAQTLTRRPYPLLSVTQTLTVRAAWRLKCIDVLPLREWLSARVIEKGTPNRAQLCGDATPEWCAIQRQQGLCAKGTACREIEILNGKVRKERMAYGAIGKWVTALLTRHGGRISTGELVKARERTQYAKNSVFDALKRAGAHHEGNQNNGYWVLDE